MASRFTPSPLLGQSFPLGDAISVRLRLVHFSDRRAIADLLARHGPGQAGEDDRLADGLVQFDPRRRYVLCACALIESSERLVGLGAIDLYGPPPVEPDLVVVDAELGEGTDPAITEALAGLLWGALVGAAAAAARSRAA
jgi:hypothetical protein